MNCYEIFFNPHMRKMGPWGSKHCTFGNQFYSKNSRKLRFYILLHFNARKHIISLYYLKWTEFIRNCKYVPIYLRIPRDPQLEQNSQFLVNSFHFR